MQDKKLTDYQILALGVRALLDRTSVEGRQDIEDLIEKIEQLGIGDAEFGGSKVSIEIDMFDLFQVGELAQKLANEEIRKLDIAIGRHNREPTFDELQKVYSYLRVIVLTDDTIRKIAKELIENHTQGGDAHG